MKKLLVFLVVLGLIGFGIYKTGILNDLFVAMGNIDLISWFENFDLNSDFWEFGIPIIIFTFIISISIIDFIVITKKNQKTKNTFNGFEEKIRDLYNGMSQEDVMKTLVIAPSYREHHKLVYTKKLQGYGSSSDHDTKKWVLSFNRNGGLENIQTENSYHKTYRY